MNYQQIQQQLEEEMNKFDLIIEDWATARAMHDKMSEMKKIKHQLIAKSVEASTNAEREREAYAHPDYRKYINELYKQDVQFYILDARKTGIEQRIGVLRSLLSFEKNQIQNTI